MNINMYIVRVPVHNAHVHMPNMALIAINTCMQCLYMQCHTLNTNPLTLQFSLFVTLYVHVRIRGADIEAEDANLNTPLLVAAGGGHVDAVATLIRWKADVDTLDKNRRSIVFIACEQKRTAVLKVQRSLFVVT